MRVVAVVFAGLLGCGGRASGVGETSAGTSEGTSTTQAATSSAGEETSTSGTGSGFVPEDDVPETCNPVAQDCPEGQKCAPGNGDFQCVDLGDEIGLGERCEPKPGEDPCAAGLFCSVPAQGTTIGVCLALCDPEDPEQWCNDTWGYTLAYCNPDVGAPFCDADCSPFGTECPPALHCSLLGNWNWECITGGTAVDGDVCAHSVDCGPQLFCGNGELLADCNEVACCSELCNSNYDGPPGCSNPEESCNWYCFGDEVPGQPRCTCGDEWDCGRGLCVVWN